jgi:hypothetical protein
VTSRIRLAGAALLAALLAGSAYRIGARLPELDIDPAVRFLSGTTAIRVAGFARQTPSLALDLDDAYSVTATMRDGIAVTAVHASGKLVIPFDPPLGAEERATISVSYRGQPPAAAAGARTRGSSRRPSRRTSSRSTSRTT